MKAPHVVLYVMFADVRKLLHITQWLQHNLMIFLAMGQQVGTSWEPRITCWALEGSSSGQVLQIDSFFVITSYFDDIEGKVLLFVCFGLRTIP